RYVAGEESALVAGAAGTTAVPSFRPDRSVPLRLGRRPVVVHNAETLAQLALVARHSAHSATSPGAAAEGAAGAPRTCLVTVSGAVPSPAVLEVPIGYRLEAILEAAGACSPAAVLAGGYGGSWLAGDMLHAAWSPAGLAPSGATPGAGVIAVLGQGECGLAATAAVVAYLAGESAGQCGPCAFGLPAMAADLAALAVPVALTGPDALAGRAGPPGPARGARAGGGSEAVSALLRRCDLVEGRGACRHPDGAARLVRSALTVFADDLEGHLAGRGCEAGDERRLARRAC
ncbi:MAG TPA: NADH-ubiquinone oxidoreductase-F iron-sulfur binding region domain-containing protein, partial [Acidimicrobiales bacterium]|nr:NADH-ubiquinone oxidoreductase-F iron-sulfur binding region domain-containing protein [Acidimicrobiales bacterium]